MQILNKSEISWVKENNYSDLLSTTIDFDRQKVVLSISDRMYLKLIKNGMNRN